jgi:glycosyltransferase involved in cell wall biosynthesis
VKVFVFNDSKFDDKPRRLARELFKNIYCIPFHGALTASKRGADYMRLRGFEKRPVEFYYDNISIQRIRAAAPSEPAPAGVAHADRYFLSIARLVEKKNHRTLLRAYAHYAVVSDAPRPLVLCGWGPLEDDLKALAGELNISELVGFAGWQQADAVVGHLSNALCLLLPSVEEQFGIAVLEAQAMGLPVIVSENVGARDLHVRSGVNGFLVEADNPLGLSYFMQQLADDPVLWRRLSKQAYTDAELGDAVHFVHSVFRLCGVALPAVAQGGPTPSDALGTGMLQSA